MIWTNSIHVTGKNDQSKGVSAQNKKPHLLSCGGYKNLEEKIIEEKAEARPPPSEGDYLQPP